VPHCYYPGDFTHAGSPIADSASSTLLGTPQYGGNISSTMSAIGHRTPTGKFETTVGETYRYDQLQRLKSSSFASMASAAWSATTQYATSYSYDANGNLDTLDRNAHDSSGSNAMDKLRYSYQSGSNKLVRVTDAVTGDPFKEDITSQPANNYQYDASGNLTRDMVQGVTYIWNADGSIRQVKATPTGRTTTIDYTYDASGNRVVKVQSDRIQGQAMSTVTTTFYVYGGDGQVMSIYEKRCSYPYDSDLDGKPDSVDKCPYMASMGNLDSDGDGVGDPCDNCPTTWNPDQADSDRDGIGDVCDNCASIWNPTQKDNNHNGSGDVCEVGYPIPDSDGDGLADNVDPCPLVPNYGTTGGDADEDGIPNNCDNCVSVANANQRDVNRNGVGDACESLGSGGGCEYVLVEQPIYGLGREGEVVTGGQPLSTPAPDTMYTRYVGQKLYELSDHLGNARVILSDRKLSDLVGGLPKKFRADVRSYANLYPFGMEQPGRYMGGDAYRYGYQGMEKDSGAGAEQYTTYFRAYDPRIGRWLSTDPITHEWESPYAAMGNSPMAIVDPLGGDTVAATRDPKTGLLVGPAVEVRANRYSEPYSGIGLYEAEDYKGTIPLSDFSYSGVRQAGEYWITSNYRRNSDGSSTLVSYEAARWLDNKKVRTEYVIGPNELEEFSRNSDYYARSANFIYWKGALSAADPKILAHDFSGGIGSQWKSTLTDPVGWVMILGTVTSIASLGQQTSTASVQRYLRSQGVPEAKVKEIVESFESMKIRIAGPQEYGIRYYDDKAAFARGRYLFKTFPATRMSLALDPKWNQAAYIKQWQIPQGSVIIEGPAAPQGAWLGGQTQMFIVDPNILVDP